MAEIHNSNRSVPFELEWRLLEPRDAHSLMGLRHLAITEAPSYFGTPKHIELAKTLGSYRRQLKFDRVNGRSLILGVWADAQLIGMAGMKIRRVQGQDLGLIYSMYVKSAYRKQGIGKKLVLKARHEIHRRWKLRTIQMNVEVGNETALRLYQSCGFKIVGKDEQAFWIDGVSHDVYVLA